MRLRRARVQNYKSIVDSGIVDIEDKVSVLIGKNEQGKTTFLKGLASANPGVSYLPGDFPNHLRPELSEKKAAEIPVVTLWLSIEPSDKEVVQRLLPDAETIEGLKIVKYYDGHRAMFTLHANDAEKPLHLKAPQISNEIAEIKKLAEGLKSKLADHASRNPEFAPHLPAAVGHVDQLVSANYSEIDKIDNLIRTFATGLTSVPGADAPIQEDVSSTIKAIEVVNAKIKSVSQSDDLKAVEAQIPQFVFHSTTLDKIPNDVNVAEFVKSPNTVSKGMANLCGVAGLSHQKIQELSNSTDSANRDSHEDHFRAAVSGGINEFWTQEEYQIYFRFEKEKMSVTISDGTYARRIAPLDRSDGFQWYLSFFAALLNEVSQARPTVFVLDNPGLEFHADGQRDIKRFLEEKLPANAQVIYVTHSPAMIDPFNLEQVRQVELKSGYLGTRVGRLAFKEGEGFDLLEPVRSAIGASLASSLVLNEFNVLVEGAADKPILEGAFIKFGDASKRKIVVNGSVSETKEGFLVRFYERAKLPFVVFVDADSGGRELAKAILGWDVAKDKIVDLAKVALDRPKGNDFELEDVLSTAFYHSCVVEAYPGLAIEPPPAENELKRTKYYEKLFRDNGFSGFNKRRVADQVKKHLLEKPVDEETEKALRNVVQAIISALESQMVGAKAAKSVKAETAA